MVLLIYPVVGLLNHTIALYLFIYFEGPPKCFHIWRYQFTSPPRACKGSFFFTKLISVCHFRLLTQSQYLKHLKSHICWNLISKIGNGEGNVLLFANSRRNCGKCRYFSISSMNVKMLSSWKHAREAILRDWGEERNKIFFLTGQKCSVTE